MKSEKTISNRLATAWFEIFQTQKLFVISFCNHKIGVKNMHFLVKTISFLFKNNCFHLKSRSEDFRALKSSNLESFRLLKSFKLEDVMVLSMQIFICCKGNCYNLVKCRGPTKRLGAAGKGMMVTTWFYPTSNPHVLHSAMSLYHKHIC